MIFPKRSLHVSLGTTDNGRPFQIPIGALDRHAQILGPTGYGKSYLLFQLFTQLVTKTDSCVILLDPLGALFHMAKAWSYRQALDDRLVLIDPGEERLVVGFNPIRPWASCHPAVQAAAGAEMLLRSLGTMDFATAPRMARWFYNLMFALLESKLTLAEGAALYDYQDPRFRDVVAQTLTDQGVRGDLAMLSEATRRGGATALRFLDDQLGSSITRVHQISRNPTIRRMLGSAEQSLDWQKIFNERKVVLINMQPRQVMSEGDQRMMGLQIVSEICQEAFRRETSHQEIIPTYLMVDEFSLFASSQMKRVLDGGRQFNLRLILAHQTLSQLVDAASQDYGLYESVLTNARLKIIFGGLPSKQATEMGELLYGHHRDPYKIKHILTSLRQLSVVKDVTSIITNRSWGKSTSDGWSTSEGSGSAFGEAAGQTLLVPGDPSQPAATMMSSGLSSNLSSFSGSGEFGGQSESESSGIGIVHSKMVQPTEPFPEVSSVQFSSLEEQLFEHVARMVRLPLQYAVAALDKEFPTTFRVADIEKPSPLQRFDVTDLAKMDLQLMRSLPFYNEPGRIDGEIVARTQRLLGRSTPRRTEILPEHRQPIGELEAPKVTAPRRAVKRPQRKSA